MPDSARKCNQSLLKVHIISSIIFALLMLISTTKSMTVGKAGIAYAWASWSDDKLLDTRICDLRLKLPNSDVEPLVDRV